MGRVLRFPGRRGWLAALLALALAGCATPRGADRATEAVRADGPELSGGQGRVREAFSPGGLPDGFGVAWCTNLYEALEGQVRNRQVIDAGEQRLPGYPFLRSNRFLASFAPDFSAQVLGFFGQIIFVFPASHHFFQLCTVRRNQRSAGIFFVIITFRVD